MSVIENYRYRVNALIFFGIVTGLVWFWLDSARAREAALGIARIACTRNNLQLLDESVALARVGLRWTPDGVRLRRMFRLEYSAQGADREIGYLILLGQRLEVIDLGIPPTPQGQEAPPPASEVQADNVVPFRRDRKPPT